MCYRWLYNSYIWLCTSTQKYYSELREHEKRIWKLRVEMVVSLLATTFDVFTDFLILQEWILQDGKIICFLLGLLAMFMSGIIATAGYITCEEVKWTKTGVGLHLLGLGCWYTCYKTWKHPKDMLNVYGDVVWSPSSFYYAKLVECLIESVPMMVLQCLVMVKNQNYTYFLLASTTSSFMCSSFSAISLVSVGEENFDIPRILFTVFVWTIDSFVRTLPIIYLLVHRPTLGFCIMSFEMVLSTVYVVYIMDVKCSLDNEHGLVFGWTLTFSSVYKLYSVLYWSKADRNKMLPYSILETDIRVFISSGIVVFLFAQEVLRKWQLWVFIVLAVFSCAIQARFFRDTGITPHRSSSLNLSSTISYDIERSVIELSNQESPVSNGYESASSLVVIERAL